MLVLVWLFWRQPKTATSIGKRRKLSVIIPVRNEENNIGSLLLDLNQQSIDNHDFEVIIADDDSDDQTVDMIEELREKLKFKLTVNRLPPRPQNLSPKKRAITESMKLTGGEIIVCTDGDCRVKKDWLKSISDYFEKENPVFLSSPVFFLDPESKDSLFSKLWVRLQQIEFASLIVSGAVSMKMRVPNMCSGANIAYLKSAFHKVNGFEGNEHIASGDDEFLMHKMASHFKDRVHYLKSFHALVETGALGNLKSFYHQRKRWAGKWSHYKSLSPKLMALFIFLSNAALIYAFVVSDWRLIVLKLFPEFLFLLVALSFFKSFRSIILVPFLQIIYPFYVVLFGLSSFDKKSYSWKNRKLK
ncbi:glycosyltransferase [Jiulongibacter sp. NS-SX5]|uniref:glycosyltransferase n=1 Tax=Jiulongibacter sp. NS-SX5 TaxID=3463854 RepID=UPI00405A3FA4